jgi:hypothetical protein
MFETGFWRLSLILKAYSLNKIDSRPRYQVEAAGCNQINPRLRMPLPEEALHSFGTAVRPTSRPPNLDDRGPL